MSRIGRSIRLLAVVATLALQAGLPHAGEPHDPAAHELLPVDEMLTLAEVVDRTLERYPDAAELPARLEQARAWRSRSASLLADQPFLSFRYQTDRWGDDAGLREYEGGIELPLWRWGQREAARSLAEAMGSESAMAEAALRWQVGGHLRVLLWEMADAERGLDSVQGARDIARRLSESVEQRHQLGDVPMGDVLLARSSALAVEEAVVDAEALVADTQRRYRMLTALGVRPPYRAEMLSETADVTPDHPALALAEAELEGARARAELDRRAGRGAPTLLIGPRWERPPMGSGYDDSIGVTLTVPIPGTSHSRTAVADAGRAVAAARAARDGLLRSLELALHEAAHGLAVAEANLATARRRAQMVQRQAELGRSAYEQGELDLMDLLRLEESAVTTDRHLARLEVEVARQVALYNQSVGDMP